jgi:hypothetical protein
MKQIVSVGIKIPDVNNDSNLTFRSNYSFADADIILFRPEFDQYSYSFHYPTGTFHGKPSYSPDSSFQIKEHTERWKNELNDAFNVGKTIIILLSERYDFYIHTGRKEVSGTGRNQKVTDIVELYSNYRFLPFNEIKITHSVGNSIYCKDKGFQNFFNAFKENLVAENYIEADHEKQVVFCTKKGERTLGCVLKGKNDGMLVLLPNIVPLRGENKKEPKNQKKWTKEAITFGNKLRFYLLDLDKAVRQTNEEITAPDWIAKEQYALENSRKTLHLIEDNLTKIKKLEAENETLTQVVREEDKLKGLLFETGKPLENSVIRGLKILGYSAENYEDANMEVDQVITSPEGERFIGECEGKDNKDIDVSKFRQLLDNLNEDFQREEITEKAFGLLFGNPQRLIEPAERTLDFTAKCKSGARRENIGLIRTTDLYFVCQYILETQDEDFKQRCREAIRSQLGGVVQFPKIG